jgi:acetyl-CoA carboxylase biotin carboxyl carrier protein
MSLRYDQVADLVKIIDASACDEFILETPELKLTIRRRGAGAAADIPERGPAIAPTPASVASRATDLAAERGARRAGVAGTEIAAPMVGTFYRAPSPTAPPFVELGTPVKQGQPLCVIEVMKLFTTIYAETNGFVASIGAENGELVEYGRVLFVIEDA